VQEKSAEEDKINKNLKTQIVCKYFLESVEKKSYGWFWNCPNGGDKCMYQHRLPPGFVLKEKKKKEEVDENAPTLEERLEEERAKLITRTPLTLELFLKWKQEKKQKLEQRAKDDALAREADIKSGKIMRSGREMFQFNPDLFVDEEDTLDYSTMAAEPEETDGPIHILEATGTSLSRKDIEGMKNGKEDINEELFQEEELPDDEDNENEENQANEDQENQENEEQEEKEGEEEEEANSD